MELGDFEKGVFRDWMLVHDVPDPNSVLPRKQQECPWYNWLSGLGKQRLARLYEVLHRFRFCEVVEIPCIEEPTPESAWDYPEQHAPIQEPGLYAYPPPDDDGTPAWGGVS